MTALIYLRVSTDEQAESRLGLEAQERACRDKAQSLKCRNILVFRDEGVSGATPVDKRPGLTELLRTIKKGDVILVARRDRIARDSFITMSVERAVQNLKARLVSVAGEGTESTDMIESVMLKGFADTFAQVERLMIQRRIRGAMQAKKDRGEHCGNPPFGYRKNGKMIEPHPDEQVTVQRILTLHREGKGPRKIARLLTESHTPNRRSTHWLHTQVLRILNREHAPRG